VKLTIEQSPDYADPEIIVRCNQIDDELRDIISYIGISDKNIIGECDGATFFIPLRDVYYFEAVDNYVFICTKEQVYRSTARLYALEQQLQGLLFSRISKSIILNLKQLRCVAAIKNARMQGTLTNGEKLIISRQYVPQVKKILGV
jgi:DNA-binding LytR/AlgR family response regulator